MAAGQETPRRGVHVSKLKVFCCKLKVYVDATVRCFRLHARACVKRQTVCIVRVHVCMFHTACAVSSLDMSTRRLRLQTKTSCSRDALSSPACFRLLLVLDFSPSLLVSVFPPFFWHGRHVTSHSRHSMSEGRNCSPDPAAGESRGTEMQAHACSRFLVHVHSRTRLRSLVGCHRQLKSRISECHYDHILSQVD